MNVNFLRISVLVAATAFLLTGCLGDETITDPGSNTSGPAYEEPVPDNDQVNASVFQSLNLDHPGLEAVKAAADAEQWGEAAVELQKYFRYRTVVNPNVNLLTTPLSDAERATADFALKENGYRFKVANYEEGEGADAKPYSYITKEGSIDWTLNPTGEQEQRSQLHRFQWAVAQAKTYAVDKDARYLNGWMEVYDSWWAANPAPQSYPEGNQPVEAIGWLPLNIAARVIDLCQLIEYYKWADEFSPVYLTHFLARLNEQVAFIENNYWADSNHRISQAQAVAIAGVIFPELKNAAAWMTNGSQILSEETTRQYHEDGWLKDNDLHYHIGSIESFRQALFVAAANNRSAQFNSAYTEAIRKMVEVEKYMIYPNYSDYNAAEGDYNYSTPNFGDTRPVSWTRNILLRHMRNYRDLFPEDEQLRWFASKGLEGTPVPAGIKCFNDGGHYVMRGQPADRATKEGTMMVLVNARVNPGEKWHRQWDSNNFELYINGRHFFPDSGCFSYGGEPESNQSRAKYAATSAHSTLTLDGKNVSDCKGTCLKAESNAQFDLLVLENPSYAGLTHRRAVFFVERKFFVIADEGYGNAAGEVNLNFHLAPGTAEEVVVDAAANGAHTAFADKNNIICRTFSSGEVATTARKGFVSTALNATTERQSYQVDQTKSAEMKASRFVTVIYPTKEAADQLEANFTNAEFSASGASLRVVVNGKTYNLSYTL